jgi:hypothetical protein
MNSATDILPDGLGSSSGQLGHNVMDHHFRVALEVPSKDMKNIEYGSRPTGIIFRVLEML